ncbi:hypothetical protein BS618_32335 [Rhodococcus erythropolis]|uniref:hypothetical protein n=1 Tax=Rhodococcus qingshengii TaxID=334542 RepID=UPI000936502F|nr:hypothetical protein [Rhodococcus qingshengii]MCZ4548094.1 hypothetical protein [Rhodococcus qingshengii]OKA08541.1 hypothetical protein BS618_32335 [Rhodococcus erythropolis]
MSEHSPTYGHNEPPQPSRLETEIAAKFAGIPNAQLIRKMEHAQDFGYDDEEFELNRRLKLGGLAWRWSGDFYRPTVEVHKPEDVEQQPDTQEEVI